MKPAPISLPLHLAARVPAETAVCIVGVGEVALLTEPLLGFISSRECPGHILIETLERVPQWVQEGRIVISGFHAPLEQQVLRSLLRREGRAVKVLARGVTDYRPTADEQEPLAQGRLLILSALPPQIKRITRETALRRNHLVRQLSAEVCTPYIAPGSLSVLRR
jgi:predicted Rossmann fold nucleotide-binding protein DprA/Smf involved in DNA uptake